MTPLEKILNDLIKFESITPYDLGCQDYMIHFFEKLGFVCEKFDNAPVSNFFARFGDKSPLLVFAGHTDVVSVGDQSQWLSNPFQLHEEHGHLLGRGVADMKGALAAMMHMAKSFIEEYPHFPGSLGFLITSGEEGEDYEKGTPFVMEALTKQGIAIDYCIVGEPSSTQHVGDMIKVGRRGSLSGFVHLKGKQGHVAYPHLAMNPIHQISPVLKELTQRTWDEGNDYFPPTTFQITQIQAGTNATNVIPGDIHLHFNFRFSTELSVEQLKNAVISAFEKENLNPDIHWVLSGHPFLTAKGRLLEKTIESIEYLNGKKPELSTSGGTSDGRFIAPYEVEVLELGLVNASIHQINEWTRLEDLVLLEKLYFEIAKRIFV